MFPEDPGYITDIGRETESRDKMSTWEALCLCLLGMDRLKHVQMELWSHTFRRVLRDSQIESDSPYWLRPIHSSERHVIEPLAQAARRIRLRGNKVELEIGTDWVPRAGEPDWTGGEFEISRLWGTEYTLRWSTQAWDEQKKSSRQKSRKSKRH